MSDGNGKAGQDRAGEWREQQEWEAVLAWESLAPED